MYRGPGIRVVRGPDWKWMEQDGGNGHLGTVISFGRTELDSALNTVNVRWDRGLKGDYRMGFGDAYDLRIFDNGTAGVSHLEIECSGCSQRPIYGIRWQCEIHPNINLCSVCYHADKKCYNDQYFRITIPGAKRAVMPRRSDAQRTPVEGLLPGAKVVKGSDLDLSPDDGRKLYMGTIFSLCDWEEGYHNSGAVVDWPPHGRDTYRVGYQGKMDLKTKHPGSWSTNGCYLDHLPVLGHPIEMEIVGGLVVGDHVTIVLEQDLLQDLQQGHGDWVPGMAEEIGHVGVIEDITVDQNVVVEYPQRRRKWIFNPAVLTKLEKFKVGDTVSITSDLINALNIERKHLGDRKLQKLHQSVGKLATIVEADETGNYRIKVDETGLDLNHINPVILKAMSRDIESSGSSGRIHDVTERIVLNEMDSMSDRLAIEAARGNMEAVKQLINLNPEWVNIRRGNQTALQLASHGGFMDVVQVLLEGDAEIDMRDNDGDTALMYAIYGNHPVIVDYLLLRGADVNIANKDEHRSSLHQAVTRGYVECVRVLLKYDCDVNMQDNFGETALYDAISGHNQDILSLLISDSRTDLRLTNKRKFNAVHWAALKGNLFAIGKLIARDASLVDISTEEGQTPLHIAAMNNFSDIVRILVVKGHCNINAYTKGQQTPLLLAVSAGHVEVIETLLSLQADVNAADADGDTSLHTALLRQIIFPEVTGTIALQKIRARIPDKSRATYGLALACLLVENKADLNHVNNKGQTSFDIVSDEKIYAILRHFVPENGSPRGSETQRKESQEVESSAVLQSPIIKPSASVPEHLRMQGEREAKLQSLRPSKSDVALPKGKSELGSESDSDFGLSILTVKEDMRDRKEFSEEVKLQERKLQSEPEHLVRQQEKEVRLGSSQTPPDTNPAGSTVRSRSDTSGNGCGHRGFPPSRREQVIGEPEYIVRQGENEVLPSSPYTPPSNTQGENIGVGHDTCGSPGFILPTRRLQEASEPVTRQQRKEMNLYTPPTPPSSNEDEASAGGDASYLHGTVEPEHLARQRRKEMLLSSSYPASNDNQVDTGTNPGAGDGGDSSQSKISARRGVTPIKLPPRAPHEPMAYTATPTPTTLPPNIARCRLGCGKIADGQFMPCGHIISCFQCSVCFKLCHECKKGIDNVLQLSKPPDLMTNADAAMGEQAAITPESGIEGWGKGFHDSDSELTKSVLVQKNRKLAEELQCGICLHNRKEIMFLCGHSMCQQCTEEVDECPFCREKILKKIKMY